MADGWRPALGFALEASGSSPRCWDSLRNLPLAPRLPAAHRERWKPGRNATRLRILPWQFRALLAAAAPGNTGDQTAVEPARNICAEASRAGSPPRNWRKTMKAIKARALGACESWVTWPSGCRRTPDRQSKGLYSEDLGPGWPLPCKSSALTSCPGEDRCRQEPSGQEGLPAWGGKPVDNLKPLCHTNGQLIKSASFPRYPTEGRRWCRR